MCHKIKDMKTKLDKEQSQYLIDLGVPSGRASDVLNVYDEDDTLYYTCPIFRLDDLLDILPKEIKTEDDIYWQTMLWSGTSYFVGYRNHNTDRWLYQICLQEELIDAIYRVLVECMKNKCLKF